jgi:CBS domain-containing protein
MYAGDIMQRHVVAVRTEDTFAEAARILREHRISSVIVQDGDRPAGIVTERDVVNVVADGLDPATTKVADRMTRNLATIEPKTDIADAARIMAERRIRHLPVIDRGELVGIISIRDLLSWAVEEVTGGHELPDLERSSAALTAAVEVEQAGA